MNSRTAQTATGPVRGYLEGYYGKLLSWDERAEILKCLSMQGLGTYCYAPKEDVLHRFRWRESYSPHWRASFAQFCQSARDLNVSVIAGIAPGLDFGFAQNEHDTDFDRLLNKAAAFAEDGATHILVLWDDIEASCYDDSHEVSEGTAHARVVNRLSEALTLPVLAVPRVYAGEIDEGSNYLPDFFSELHEKHAVLLCGNAIVASSVSQTDLAGLRDSSEHQLNVNPKQHRIILWDNFYANDYCPRRLFLGPWFGREKINDYLLNATGLPYTDALLLDIAKSTHMSGDQQNTWSQALARHGVPNAFLSIAPYFSSPFFGDKHISGDDSDISCKMPDTEVDEAIETCLWQWKSPLAREWFPFIMSLKHDLAIMRNTLPRNRILKTQSAALAKKLLN